MSKNEKKPYGYIYKATNVENGKVYIGKTKAERWSNNEIPIEGRWKEEVKKANYLRKQKELNPNQKIRTRHIEYAINKYGSDKFILKQKDIAYSKSDLNAKESFWIDKYDSMNKGYNETKGGEGGEKSKEVKEQISQTMKQYYKENPQAAKERAEKTQEFRQKNPQAVKKMGEKVKQYYKENPQAAKERAEKLKQYYKENPQAAKERAEKTQQYFKENPQAIKEIGVKIKQYYKDNPQAAKERAEKLKQYYKENPQAAKNRAEKTQQFRQKNPQTVKEMGEKVKQYYKENPQAAKERAEKTKQFRQKNPQAVKEMGEKVKQYYKENPQAAKIRGEKLKKEISNIQEFIKDVKNNISSNDLAHKYKMSGPTINERIKDIFGSFGPQNYTDLKNYLHNKTIEDALKEVREKNPDKIEGSNATVKDGDDLTEGKVKDIDEIRDNENQLVNNDGLPTESFKEFLEKENIEGLNNIDEQKNRGEGLEKESTNEQTDDTKKDQEKEIPKEKLIPLNKESSFNKDVKGEFKTINKDIFNAFNDYEGINEFSHDEERDIGGINENINSDNRDFAGINDIPDDYLKDFEGINDHPEDLKEKIEDNERSFGDDKERDIKELEPSPEAKEAKEEIKTDFGPENDKRDFDYA